MKAKVTEALVRAKLDDLGDTPERMAESLRVRGVKGQPCSSTFCPLAEYLKREFDASSVSVAFLIYVHNGQSVELRPQPHWLSFINQFDGGRYPDLIASVSGE